MNVIREMERQANVVAARVGKCVLPKAPKGALPIQTSLAELASLDRFAVLRRFLYLDGTIIENPLDRKG